VKTLLYTPIAFLSPEGIMNYSAENNQNSPPGSIQAAKLGASRKGPDAQSVAKR
jgi:hypothetical protein